MHHIELWTSDVEVATPSFDWLFATLGWALDHDPAWSTGRIWQHPSGAYLVLEQSPDISGPLERTHTGLNHLALRSTDRDQLDHLRAEADQHGWRKMFSDRYSHTGGSDHTALLLENTEGFEIELVADSTFASAATIAFASVSSCSCAAEHFNAYQ